MRKERIELSLDAVLLNEGQVDWLPRNPRTWTQTDIDKTAASIVEDPDFLEERPILVIPFQGKTYIAFAGNLRHEGSKAAKRATAPCVIYYPETESDREAVRRRAMKDNGSFGKFDWDEIANNPVWGRMRLADFGIPVWDPDAALREDAENKMRNGGLSTEGQEGDEEYEEFTEKFQQKLTTDDCYTPPAVYDAVLAFVKTITDTKGCKIVRPFFPGGNYEDLSQYPKNCIVVDNPPFSIISQIIRYYCEKGIKFFIFAPALTLFTAADCDVSYIVSDSDIIYENGAHVCTGFITNLLPDVRIWCCPELARSIEEATDEEDKTKQGFVYPDNIVTAATLMKLVRRDVELKVAKKSCEYIKDCESAKEQGRALFGGGFIMSDPAAAERAAAERAAAERAAATRLNLSPKEKAIIARLNEREKEE